MLKKVLIYVFMIISIFMVTACSKSDVDVVEKDPNAPPNLREITGKVSNVKLDSNGDIVLNKDEITDEVSYYSYEFEGVVIGLLAVRDSSGKVIVVINTCQSCGGSPYAYFVQVGNKIQCQNCGNYFDIDSLDNLEEDGCNPIGIVEKVEDDKKITISHVEIEQYKEKFENWKGPKV